MLQMYTDIRTRKRMNSNMNARNDIESIGNMFVIQRWNKRNACKRSTFEISSQYGKQLSMFGDSNKAGHVTDPDVVVVVVVFVDDDTNFKILSINANNCCVLLASSTISMGDDDGAGANVNVAVDVDVDVDMDVHVVSGNVSFGVSFCSSILSSIRLHDFFSIFFSLFTFIFLCFSSSIQHTRNFFKFSWISYICICCIYISHVV